MIIGVVKEIKAEEYRVALTPAGCAALVEDGHDVLVETGAGVGSGFDDSQYAACGGRIISTAAKVFEDAGMIMKVKEPQASEWPMMRRGQTMFTYFHFAASRELTEGVAASGSVAIAYETITDRNGHLPLLTPMSEVAGRMAAQVGARCLEKPSGGNGKLIGGVPGTSPANVTVLGGGVVGTQAARIAAGMGANVTIMDINLDRLRYLDDVMPANCRTLMSYSMNVREILPTTDLLIGSVLVPGAKAPKLVTKKDLTHMCESSVLVDVCVDQGGCAETTRPTTHHAPTFVEAGVLHYCVANMPGAVPRTSTIALTNATLPYARRLAGMGWREAAATDVGLSRGVNMVDGAITCREVAEAHGMDYQALKL